MHTDLFTSATPLIFTALLLAVIAGAILTCLWLRSFHMKEVPLAVRVALAGIIIPTLVLVSTLVGSKTAESEPLLGVDDTKVETYVQETSGRTLVDERGWFSGLAGGRGMGCITDDACRGYIVSTPVNDYWFKVDQDTDKRYFVNSKTGEHVDTRDVAMASKDDLRALLSDAGYIGVAFDPKADGIAWEDVIEDPYAVSIKATKDGKVIEGYLTVSSDRQEIKVTPIA